MVRIRKEDFVIKEFVFIVFGGLGWKFFWYLSFRWSSYLGFLRLGVGCCLIVYLLRGIREVLGNGVTEMSRVIENGG